MFLLKYNTKFVQSCTILAIILVEKIPDIKQKSLPVYIHCMT